MSPFDSFHRERRYETELERLLLPFPFYGQADEHRRWQTIRCHHSAIMARHRGGQPPGWRGCTAAAEYWRSAGMQGLAAQ
eukprot:SAG11_NODE_2016_length_3919_cov_4.215445_1_plen_80_part_00